MPTSPALTASSKTSNVRGRVLDTLGVAAVGLCSNKATEEQVARIAVFAKSRAKRRVVLMPDCDAEGCDGLRELLWKLNEQELDVRVAWSPAMFNGKYTGKQPEDLTADDWHSIDRRLQK